MDILLSLRNTSNRVDTGALPPFQFSYLRNRKSLSEFWRDCPILADNSKEHNCMPYEHYTATLLAVCSYYQYICILSSRNTSN
ncbi:hypothetical protein HanXRQr2_Chr11g0500581 [Helianthus annuus]|uniref:Uncharacterized protein n=1 Tax=Helianthus annuus TaxID=4232 RepID=A0A251V4X7_HELAN|nr:glycosyltransferase BC10-like [Helianthus annuus]XP_035833251.1 glycosyltransferase BC10-like [Helianthus annuus]KAF5782821.1 hypothetical protein HanXRQr2_Chr11g0500581 [Helianthus annuus]KAJ0501823.1 hypothetical protein HanHA300_Chr11g0405561 [Helianthus annuus]KAJ0517750.1 hypothetical protein HanHA89_Chr11g0429281 [Helianthus annuus]KAJ0685767.1 hypothetical protein HanLR1_Chr11g0406781 [Helianthus annuus]KAJ0689641.1 hypothetical protein HanOQP8_Chr11g0408401 [Helianthus annuus]